MHGAVAGADDGVCGYGQTSGRGKPRILIQSYLHTKVEITANVSVKDAGGSVIETAQVNKSGDFVEGNVSDPAVQAEIQGIVLGSITVHHPFSCV